MPATKALSPTRIHGTAGADVWLSTDGGVDLNGEGDRDIALPASAVPYL